MSINVLDSNDRPSEIILNSSLSIPDNVTYTVVIAENSPTGTSLTNLSVVDEDVGQQHRCMLLERGNNFYISSLSKSSSEIRVKHGANLSYESIRGTPLQGMFLSIFVRKPPVVFLSVEPTSFPGAGVSVPWNTSEDRNLRLTKLLWNRCTSMCAHHS